MVAIVDSRANRDKPQNAAQGWLHWVHPRAIEQVKEFGINEVPIPPSEKFPDRHTAVEDLTLWRENEYYYFSEFGDE